MVPLILSQATLRYFPPQDFQQWQIKRFLFLKARASVVAAEDMQSDALDHPPQPVPPGGCVPKTTNNR